MRSFCLRWGTVDLLVPNYAAAVPAGPTRSHFVSGSRPQHTISSPLVPPLLTNLVCKMLANADKFII